MKTVDYYITRTITEEQWKREGQKTNFIQDNANQYVCKYWAAGWSSVHQYWNLNGLFQWMENTCGEGNSYNGEFKVIEE